MSKYIDLDNPKIHKMGRDKFGDVIYHIPPDMPLADVRENVHGEWILDDSSINCSVCGRSRWSVPPFENLVKSFNYCPHCGADIREEVEE